MKRKEMTARRRATFYRTRDELERFAADDPGGFLAMMWNRRRFWVGEIAVFYVPDCLVQEIIEEEELGIGPDGEVRP
jgi:hypothetical protein